MQRTLGVGVIRMEALDHPHHWEGETFGKRKVVTLRNRVAERSIERLACERGDENGFAEASGADRRLAGGKKGATDAATRPIGMNEEGADPSRVVGWVESDVLCVSCAIAAEDSAATTPTATTDDVAGVLDDKVSAVADQLAVHAKDGAKCCLHLCGRIERCLQKPHGKRNENLQSRDVILSR